MKRLIAFLLILLGASAVHAGTITMSKGGTGSITSRVGGTGRTTLEQIPAAAGPTCADGGAIGTTTHNTALSVANNQFRFSDFPVVTEGKITGCWAWHNNNSGELTIGVYDTSGNILAYVNASGVTSQNWSGGLLNTELCLVPGTYYVGVVSNDTGWNLYRRDSYTGVTRYQITMTYGTTLANADFSSPTVNATNTGWSITCNDLGAP